MRTNRHVAPPSVEEWSPPSSRWPARRDRVLDGFDRFVCALSSGRAVIILAVAFAAAVIFNVGRACGWWS